MSQSFIPNQFCVGEGHNMTLNSCRTNGLTSLKTYCLRSSDKPAGLSMGGKSSLLKLHVFASMPHLSNITCSFNAFSQKCNTRIIAGKMKMLKFANSRE